MKKFAAIAVVLLAALALAIPGAHYYYEASWGEGCGRCHEIRENVDQWHASTHRNVNCLECHDSSIETNLRHVRVHASGDVPEVLRLRRQDVTAMVAKCRNCHRQEFAQWQMGAHSANYKRVLNDEAHNKKRALMDDCLRCHGMHYQGAIQTAVSDSAAAAEPAIPCLACHAVHRNGMPLTKSQKQERVRPSLGLYDRRTQDHISLAQLPVPAMMDGARRIRMSVDQRQALCYQCHAPLSTMQVASADDRTPMGVHEGISCLACHQKHSQTARASCANCHPKMSNCGLDVEKMDTTFLANTSKHNVHWVKCQDCHTQGVPPKRRPV